MSTISEFQEFADALRERCHDMRRTAPALIGGADRELPIAAAERLCEASSMIEATLDDLGAAAEELQVQNDALFAARVEMEAEGRFYRELFDLAPVACLVTTAEGRITHANHAATCLFGRPANALAGRLMVGFVDLRERAVFRAALTRAQDAPSVEEFPVRLVCAGADAIDCRVRVSARHDRAGGRDRVTALQWIITEDGASDSDLL